MYRLNYSTRVAAFGALVLVAAGCETTKRDVLGPSSPPNGDIFKSYISIGNSITAGFQSNGINDSTQRQSYAVLLGKQMGTPFHYPSINMPGCTPPIANTQTGALVGGVPASTCALRASASVTDILNNVAVPGARVLDPASASTVASNALTTFILGGLSQVQRALLAKPTFATVWIGNNDVLQAGLSGLLNPVPGASPGVVSTPAQFQVSYDSLTNQLIHGAPGIKGVLIGVAQVGGLPSLSSGGLIASSPQIQGGISAAAGTTVAIHPSCTGSTSLINVPQLIPQIRAFNPATGAGHPPIIVCSPNQPGFPAPVGDIFVLDANEQASLSATITAYNTYIAARAATLGFAYYDPNPLFVAKRATGEIPPFPNLA
ncbi:MAG: SGNH/GDSL hydrolase family protein, partial [bacterium]